jgi:hypothetical protein
MDFVQQTGRGGRGDGEIVESVVVMDQRKARMDEKGSDVEHLNHQAMEWFVESQVCRRVTLGMFMDMGLEGCGQDCEQLQCEMCDRCREKQERREEEEAQKVEEGEEAEDGEDNDEEEDEEEDESAVESDDSSDEEGCRSNRFSEHIKEKHARVAELRGWLDEVGDRCPVCFVAWRGRGGIWAWRQKVEHCIQECPRFEFKKYVEWRGQVDFAEFRCCWPCGLPQSFCDGWERKQACEWGDKMMPLVWWVTKYPGWRDMIRTRFGVEIEPGNVEKERAYVRWVGRSRRMYDEDMTNAMAVWDMVIQDSQKVKGK